MKIDAIAHWNSMSEARFLIKLMRYRASEACEAVCELESLVAKTPACLQIDFIGFEDIPPDMSLLIHSVLQRRSPKTELITFARSSLRGNAALVWLQGDRRLIREDARLFFRRPRGGPPSPGLPAEEACWHEPGEPSLEELLENGDEVEAEDYRRVLALIDHYLPVGELAGKQVGVNGLRELGW